MLIAAVWLALLATADVVYATPAPLSLRTRRSIACLTFAQRQQLAETIAIDLISKPHASSSSELDLDYRVAEWLQNEDWIGQGVCGQDGEQLTTRTVAEKRLFGLGGDDDDSSGYAPRKLDCPAGQTFVRASVVSFVPVLRMRQAADGA